MGLQLDGLTEIKRTLEDINKMVESPREMNRKRGKAFEKWTRGAIGGQKLGLKKITKATQKIQGSNHAPMFNKKEFIDQIKTRLDDQDNSETGFFADDSTKPTPRRTSIGYTSTSRLTWYQIAQVHENGYSIPVAMSTPKGIRVRRWLAAHGIFVSKRKYYIEVKPRPVISRAHRRYAKTGRDGAVAAKEFSKAFDKI